MEVKAGEKVKCETGAEKLLHLSQACLGETKKDKGNASVPVYLHIDGKKLVVGTLNPDKCAQISYDLVFEKDFELSHGWKDGSVFFVGYKTIISDEPDDFSDSSEEEEEEEPVAQPAPKVNGKPAKKEIVASKPNEPADKGKGKSVVAVKPSAKENEEDEDEEDDESDESDEEGESEDGSDEEMADGDDSEEDEDDSSEEEEEKVTPKKDKKRPAVEAKTPITDNKKAKVVTPAGKTGADAKKVPHAATPYPKQAGKTPASAVDKSTQQTPKSGGSHMCKPCNRGFGSDAALQSHTKAKHSS